MCGLSAPRPGAVARFGTWLKTASDFREPEDWCPEEEDEVKATIELYRVITSLRASGHQVDCLDLWVDTPADQIREKPVNLAAGAGEGIPPP